MKSNKNRIIEKGIVLGLLFGCLLNQVILGVTLGGAIGKWIQDGKNIDN